MMPSQEKQPSGNRLRDEKSPYLLQHALNPVDWRPWGEEAFAAARNSDRPLFISIGYSTCHWCHVMERESFEDQEVARLLNENFIPVKVDREERPDIDRLYMSACTLLTGSGGWPLTVIATPDGKPFFSGTYFPRQGRFGRPGLLELLPRIAEIWRSRREEVLLSVNEIAEALSTLTEQARGTEPGVDTLDRAFEYFDGAFDSEHGGFGPAPKFPSPHNLGFLLRYWRRSGRTEALTMVERTLDSLCRGGICDHLGGGFHRYSTDRRWQVPHFEKMLYDQALIAIALIEAFQATGKERYASAARRTFEYVLRDLATPEGGLYCAEDADSEGKEGRFYLWSAAEVRRVLGPEQSALAYAAWNIQDTGNYHDEAAGSQSGLNILFRDRELSAITEEKGIPLQELENRLESARQALFKERAKRVRPFLDTKVLADWNGLMISALARGARVLDSPEYARAAVRAAEFILLNMRSSRGGLLHRWCGGEAAVPGLADDYALMVQGLIDLYEATFQNKWLREAINLNAIMLDLFWDDKDGGGLFFSAVGNNPFLVRQKELYDGASPSANSVAALNFLRLARMTGDSSLELKAREIFRVFSGALGRNPAASCQALCALDFALGPTREIVLAGNSGPETARPFIRTLWSAFEPGRVVLFHSQEDEFSLSGIAPFTRGMNPPEGKDIAAFVCRDGACSLPVTEPAGLGEPGRR